MLRENPCFLFFLIILVLSRVSHSEKTNPTTNSTSKPVADTKRISLANFNISNTNGQAFYNQTSFHPLSYNFIEIYNIPEGVSFLIVQIHTPENNVTLSYIEPADCKKDHCSLQGSNIGLEIRVDGNSSVRIAATNDRDTFIDALVAVVAYTDKVPVPGGCNLEFDVEIAPYQKLHLTDAVVIVEAQPASGPQIKGVKPNCDKDHVKLEAYRLYLPERDYTTETYYASIQKMLTVKDIIDNGQKILSAIGVTPMRRVFSAYPGTGSVHAMIATYGNYSSAYVPTATYACSPISSPSSCEHLNTTIAKALCAITLITGLIITFIGHKCLGFEVVYLGAVSGGIISYSILTAIGDFETSTGLGIVMGVSFLSGFAWLVLSCYGNMPCTATFLAAMTLGFFVASTIYFGIADDTPLFVSDVNFWLIYAGVTLLVPIVLAVLPFSSNVVCCAILGSYSIILPIDYYTGSNLKYIVINTVRRAAVQGFNVAVIQPPYQGVDKCLVAFLIIIALLGIYVQVGKFCCCPCKRQNTTTVFWDETQPIISLPRGGRRVLVFGENQRVEHSHW